MVFYSAKIFEVIHHWQEWQTQSYHSTHFESSFFIFFLYFLRHYIYCVLIANSFFVSLIECLFLHFLSRILAARIVSVTSPDMAPGNHMVVETSSQRPFHITWPQLATETQETRSVTIFEWRLALWKGGKFFGFRHLQRQWLSSYDYDYYEFRLISSLLLVTVLCAQKWLPFWF